MHSISALEHLKILTNLQEYKVSHMMHESNHMMPYYHVWCLSLSATDKYQMMVISTYKSCGLMKHY